MDLPGFLIGLLPVIAIGFVGVVAFRRRHDRGRTSPLILNPYTLTVEPDADALGHLPVVRPAPETTRSQKVDPPSAEAEDSTGPRGPDVPPSSPEER